MGDVWYSDDSMYVSVYLALPEVPPYLLWIGGCMTPAVIWAALSWPSALL